MTTVETFGNKLFRDVTSPLCSMLPVRVLFFLSDNIEKLFTPGNIGCEDV
jgi:hypothetical protein